MGVHVILDIDPDGIDGAAWTAVYEETLTLLEAWHPRLLGWGSRTIDGAVVPMYRHSIRSNGGALEKAYWCVVGDRASLQSAESQSLYRSLDHYQRRRARRPSVRDIVIAAAAPKNEDTGGPVRVFGDKTQGYPYHYAVLAAAMVVEERFPRHAMVWGDIDRGQAEQARLMAAPILGRELPLPVRVDAARLIERLRSAYDTDAVAGAFKRMFLGESDERHEPVLQAFPGEGGAQPWKREFAEYKTANSLGVTRLLIAWLNAGRDLHEACRFACLAPDGPHFTPAALVDAIASTWVAVPLSVREALDVFHKPAGASHTVASLFGSFLLDMEAMGRHLRVYIEPAVLTATLSDVFGEKGPALAARLLNRSAKTEEQLRARVEDVKRFVDEAGARADDDTEVLASIGSAEAMGPNQQAWVRAMSWSVMKTLATLRGGDPKIVETLADAKKAKSLLVRVLSEHPPVLTEDAWDAILAEHDVEVLAWWIALASLSAHELHQSQVRRALFENAELRRYAMAIGRDEGEMREVEALIEKARTHKQ